MSESRKFDSVLDECLERMLVKGETVEQCLQSHPEYAGELKPLLETALSVRKISTLQPRPEFRNLARYGFHSALEEIRQKQSRPSFRFGWQTRWAASVAILLVVCLVGGGTVFAASGSMPDSPLYPVKLATEHVQLALTFSDIGKAEANAQLADKRVQEIVYLTGKDKPEDISRVTDSLSANLNKVAALAPPQPVNAVGSMAVATSEAPSFSVVEPPVVVTVPATVTTNGTTSGAESPVTQTPVVVPQVPVAQNVTGQGKMLTPPAPAARATPGVKAGGEGNLVSQPAQVDKSAKTANSQEDRRVRLKSTVQSQAEGNIARLQALLKTAPDSDKPALQRALKVSQDEYQKALDALDSQP